MTNYILALDLRTIVYEGNFGISYIHNSSKNESTSAFDIDLVKCYFFDRDSRFGLDLIPLSINLLNDWEDINYASLFNIDFHYSPIIFGNMFFINLYIAGGPSGIKYTIDSNNYQDNGLFFDKVLFNTSLGIRLRLLNFDGWSYPNFDLYSEYNFIKNDFKFGFYTRFFTPLTPAFMLIGSVMWW
jgi:hypothetical protein